MPPDELEKHEFNSDQQYGRVPYELVASGMVTTFSPAEVKVYLVLAAHTNRDWEATPSVGRIASLLNVWTVESSTSQLHVKNHLITCATKVCCEGYMLVVSIEPNTA